MQVTDKMPSFDWQGHRGARGLLPENTIPAFLRALSYPEVITLELDVVISADDRVIVSHDPYMEPTICQTPEGDSITGQVSLRKLTAVEIATYDCGIRPHPRFPEQSRRPATKPTLAAVFAAVDRYCVQQDRPRPATTLSSSTSRTGSRSWCPTGPPSSIWCWPTSLPWATRS